MGRDAGRGHSINLAWAHEGMGDAEYLAAFDALLMPICRQVLPAHHHLPLSPALHLPLYLPSISPLSFLYLACISPISQFAPDLVLVSCGFDAAAGDPLGGMTLKPEP